jgi:germination protein M
VKKKYYIVAVVLLMALWAAGCGVLSASDQKQPEPLTQPGEGTKVTFTLYYGEREAMGLIAEERTVTLPLDTHPVKAAIEELSKTPSAENAIVMIPAETEVRSVSVEDGLVTIDFNEKLRDNFYGGSFSEALLISGIVNTVTDMKEFTGHKVQFLINGEKFESIGGHILADEPFTRTEP